MPKINVYLPDDLSEAVRATGVPVSAICQRALEQAVRRVTAIRETSLTELSGADLEAAFPQMTGRARAVLSLAVERAAAAGSASVGTAHLLAGMIAEGGNLALHVLRAIEIDSGQLMRELDRQRGTEPADPAEDGAVHFSFSAAAALELSVTEATGLGHNYVGCEHLLLGLVAEPDGAAGHILRGAGADPRLTRRSVASALAGYVHLRANTAAALTVPSAAGGTPLAGGAPAGALSAGAAPAGAAPADPARLLAAALQPLIARIERLEQRLPAAPDSE
ncbi:Clp protease N-terminal domain-containing protein [Actinoplanes sp. NPDC051851]|uniref:Clp protease N-terminal domain-containing protein n=1 Tax=Actinoplanes sp. NPDC051851 TaxID=3154753 RepID=UPI003437F0AF